MIRHTKASGAGSRARTREIGYADAMLDMAQSLGASARTWREVELRAAEAGNMDAAEIIGSITASMECRARLADALFSLYADSRAPQDPGSFIGYQWEHSEAPRELPAAE